MVFGRQDFEQHCNTRGKLKGYSLLSKIISFQRFCEIFFKTNFFGRNRIFLYDALNNAARLYTDYFEYFLLA